MIRSLKRPALVLLSVCALAPAVSIAACSSDPATSTDGGTEASASTTATTPPPDASATTDASTPDGFTPPVDASPDAKPDASPDATVEAGTCAAKGKSDLKIDPAISSTAPANKVTVQMVDACQGTSSALPYTGTRLRFEPTDGSNHYFLVTSTDPTEFYKSASVVWNYPLAGIRNDTDMKLVAKPGVGGAADVFGSNYDATKAHFVVQLNQVGTCETGGYTVSVVGHPEAVVQYSNGGTIAVDPALTMSVGQRGSFAFVSKVDVAAGLVGSQAPRRAASSRASRSPSPSRRTSFPWSRTRSRTSSPTRRRCRSHAGPRRPRTGGGVAGQFRARGPHVG